MYKIIILRIIHGLFALYFILCMGYLYYASFFSRIDRFLLIPIISLGIEGFVVFILNNGDCPLIHIQKRIGDSTPFFQLFLPKKLAKQAIPIFASIAWIGAALLIVRVALLYIH